jgi:peptidoglycan/xylan/chitin deacetylase (PgdA/CDA1 family)
MPQSNYARVSINYSAQPTKPDHRRKITIMVGIALLVTVGITLAIVLSTTKDDGPQSTLTSSSNNPPSAITLHFNRPVHSPSDFLQSLQPELQQFDGQYAASNSVAFIGAVDVTPRDNSAEDALVFLFRDIVFHRNGELSVEVRGNSGIVLELEAYSHRGHTFCVQPDSSNCFAIQDVVSSLPTSPSPSSPTPSPSSSSPTGSVYVPPISSSRGEIRLASEVGECEQGVNCHLPNCYCSSIQIPGGLSREEAPQFVMITFDDAVNDDLWTGQVADLVFNPRRLDATECGPRITWYLTNDNTDYSMVEEVVARGHEVASHTVTHSNPTQFSTEQWTAEVATMRNYTALLVNGLDRDAVIGNRAPWLQYSDAMFTALYEDGFLYDGSVIERHDSGISQVNLESKQGNWQWPYTMDFGLQNLCHYPDSQCPRMTYPGFWQVPMTTNTDHDDTGFASEMDPALSGDALQRLFRDNFDSRYNGNRSPMGIYLHGTWLNPDRVEQLQRFLDYANSFPNVVFATPTQIIRWMQNPIPVSQALNEAYMQCPIQPYSSRDTTVSCSSSANDPQNCLFDQGNVRTCTPCPLAYPSPGGFLGELVDRPSQWTGDLDASLTGGCLDVTISNSQGVEPARFWVVQIPLLPSGQPFSIASSWGGEALFQGRTLHFQAASGTSTSIPVGTSHSAGFCVSLTLDQHLDMSKASLTMTNA